MMYLYFRDMHDPYKMGIIVHIDRLEQFNQVQTFVFIIRSKSRKETVSMLADISLCSVCVDKTCLK